MAHVAESSQRMVPPLPTSPRVPMGSPLPNSALSDITLVARAHPVLQIRAPLPTDTLSLTIYQHTTAHQGKLAHKSGRCRRRKYLGGGEDTGQRTITQSNSSFLLGLGGCDKK